MYLGACDLLQKLRSCVSALPRARCESLCVRHGSDSFAAAIAAVAVALFSWQRYNVTVNHTTTRNHITQRSEDGRGQGAHVLCQRTSVEGMLSNMFSIESIESNGNSSVGDHGADETFDNDGDDHGNDDGGHDDGARMVETGPWN
eukprot:4966849-Pleurochrysis_carterae.AAC.2